MRNEIPSKCVGCQYANIGKKMCNMYRKDIVEASATCTIKGGKSIRVKTKCCKKEYRG